MGVISRTGDVFYALRFLRLLTQPWEKTEAFKLGIVDENGRTLKKARELKNSDEKSAYTIFHRLVFNVKRLLNKLPFGKTRLASYEAALFLIKEHTGLTEDQIKKILSKVLDDIEDEEFLGESWFVQDGVLNPGEYTLVEDVCSLDTGEPIALKNTRIKVKDFTNPEGYFFGDHIYKVDHPLTNQKIYIGSRNIKR